MKRQPRKRVPRAALVALAEDASFPGATVVQPLHPEFAECEGSIPSTRSTPHSTRDGQPGGHLHAKDQSPKTRFAFSCRILRSAAFDGARRRTAAMVWAPLHFAPVPSASWQSLPYMSLSW